MPRFDGTGPSRSGPLTGKGNGYCVVKLDRMRGDSATGFAGISGAPVSIPPDEHPEESRLIRLAMHRLTYEVSAVSRRLANLEIAHRAAGNLVRMNLARRTRPTDGGGS